MKSFQLVRGYSTSFLVIHISTVTQELLYAHIEINSKRATQLTSKGHTPFTTRTDSLAPGTHTWVIYNTKKQNYITRWIQAQ